MVFLDRNTQTKILLHHEFQNQFNMQKFINVKQMILLIGLLMPTVWCSAINLGFADGLSGITINYGIDGYGVNRYKDSNGHYIYTPKWMDTDTLTVDYIRVYQLNWDCGTDELITCQNDLSSFILHPSVKNSVSIAPINGTISVGNTDEITFRVADSFEITGPFQANYGCEFTVIRQDCPE